jgi:uncharacterized protein
VKLHQSKPTAINTFSGYGEGYVMVNGQRLEHSVIVLPERMVEDWEATVFEALTSAQLESLLTLAQEDRLEVVLLGTGNRLRFPPADMLRPVAGRFAAAGIGFEFMDVHAACRTYNILVAEERKVAAALLIGASTQPPAPSEN